MLLQLLHEKEVDYCLDNWGKNEDGAKTQPRSDREKLKDNEECPDMLPEVRQLVSTRLYNNPYLESVICPNKVSVNFYNEYKEGGYYDKHIDTFRAAPKGNNVYFDYGFSLGLTDDYEGGEFVLDNEIGEIPFKLKAASGRWSNSPSIIILNPFIVSLISTRTPGIPVNCSAT